MVIAPGTGCAKSEVHPEDSIEFRDACTELAKADQDVCRELLLRVRCEPDTR